MEIFGIKDRSLPPRQRVQVRSFNPPTLENPGRMQTLKLSFSKAIISFITGATTRMEVIGFKDLSSQIMQAVMGPGRSFKARILANQGRLPISNSLFTKAATSFTIGVIIRMEMFGKKVRLFPPLRMDRRPLSRAV